MEDCEKEEEAFKRGLDAGWDLAYRVVCSRKCMELGKCKCCHPDLPYEDYELRLLFDSDDPCKILSRFAGEVAYEKASEYDEHGLKAGDIAKVKGSEDQYCIVTYPRERTCYVLFKNGKSSEMERSQLIAYANLSGEYFGLIEKIPGSEDDED